MKICLYGISTIALGKHNLRDPRLDQAHQLVEAKKKTYVQIDLADGSSLSDADAIVVSPELRADLILKDLEFVENRLERNPSEAERAALVRLTSALEGEVTVLDAPLSAEERDALAAHTFTTQRPVLVATEAELAEPDPLLLRAYHAAGFISYLTVGGKENRAWMIRLGATAWEAAGAIHSDIQKGFIRAEIIDFNDFIEAGGETQAKRAGKLRLELKSYLVRDCDIVNFRFNKT
jgi:ribosome-binding ATPase